jgi:hypothetical protein
MVYIMLNLLEAVSSTTIINKRKCSMSKSWNANIAIKSNGKIAEAKWDEVKNWAEVEKIWSTTGKWDWIVSLKSDKNDFDAAKKVAWALHKFPWVSETETWWSQEA